ncbi:MAG: glycosyltransferase [Planctomycetales bacterium]|nr:glycosyltransferase [Planctomycetales bacterium]
MSHRVLTALPVYNEARHVSAVLGQVLRYSHQVLVVDDGSRDGTADLLGRRKDIALVTHPANRGYGAALRTAFEYALDHDYEILVTIDCDGQHQPQRIPDFIAACRGPRSGRGPDIVSGSRYLQSFAGDGPPPEERRAINMQITARLNRMLGLQLTDAFCGFKAYRVESLPCLLTDEEGYGMPLELWIRAVHAGLSIRELAIPRVYLDEKRSFGGALDDGRQRLAYYERVMEQGLLAVAGRGGQGVCGAVCEETAG